jgi:hypothetical protein
MNTPQSDWAASAKPEPRLRYTPYLATMSLNCTSWGPCIIEPPVAETALEDDDPQPASVRDSSDWPGTGRFMLFHKRLKRMSAYYDLPPKSWLTASGQ